MQLHKKEKKKKEFLNLRKRENELWEIERNFPTVPIKPYQDGWIVYFDLKDEFKRRVDGHLLQQIVDLVYTSFYTKKVKLIREIRRNRGNIKNINLRVPRGEYDWWQTCHKRCITKAEYDKLRASQQKYFKLLPDDGSVWDRIPWQNYKRGNYKPNCIHHMLVLKVAPSYVTHRKVLDEEVLREQAFIKSKRDYLSYTGGATAGWGRDPYRRYFNYLCRRVQRSRWRDALIKLRNNEIDESQLYKASYSRSYVD